jgi:hypothetical protein
VSEPTTLEEWLDAASQQSFWSNICPRLSIGRGAGSSVIGVDEARLLELRDAMLQEGYFVFEEVLAPEVMADMAECVRQLHERRIPMGFAYVFDQFWQLTGWIGEVLAALLGDDFRQLPDLWAWYVEPGHKGWEEHREKGLESLLPNGMPKSLSVWVPLTDATPLNGCMYVVPANRDPYYRQEGDDIRVDNLQDVRALPARAGSVLLWNQCLLHWGGASSPRARHPRISFSIEYQRGDVEPFNTPLIDPRAPLPDFELRLGFVGKQILQYEHMYDPVDGIVSLGKALVERYPIE